MANLSLLLSLESLEKFLCGGGWWVCKPILVFSLSLGQAEQKVTTKCRSIRIGNKMLPIKISNKTQWGSLLLAQFHLKQNGRGVNLNKTFQQLL